MLFHTHEFLALLLLTLAVFHYAPLSRRPLVLLVASLIFYGYAGVAMLGLFLAVSAFAYVCLRRIEAGERGWMTIGVVVILINLMAFKYGPFLPVGISFYSFQLIAVLIDAGRGQRLEVRSFRELLLFIMFFGHLIAGPIMRGREFFPQLHVLPGPSTAQLRSGILLFVAGLIKKVVLADALLSGRVDALFASGSDLSIAAAWLAPLLFGFQIYFDFSGYVDMALGMSRFFGLELMPNFSTPFISRTPSEFWSRWNITLSRWFGDYVYIPLGGSRGSIAITVRNLLITKALSGIWHGAGWTFLVWGVIHGVYLASFHVLRHGVPRIAAALAAGRLQWLGWVVTYAVTTVAWVYFRAADLHHANAIVANMFAITPGHVAAPAAGFAIVAALLVLHRAEASWIAGLDTIAERAWEQWMRLPGPVQALAAFPILLVIVGITKGARGTFIYFQF
jgi:alginate O-acetyltransferase complex protein AlgI